MYLKTNNFYFTRQEQGIFSFSRASAKIIYSQKLNAKRVLMDTIEFFR